MFSSNTSQVSSAATYIEDVFSTWLYTGNGSTQTITNGIDLAGKGGLVWTKSRSSITPSDQAYHYLSTTSVTGAGVGGGLEYPNNSNLTDAYLYPRSLYGGVGSFNSDGFTLIPGDFSAPSGRHQNVSGTTYASWTFRKQPKFFDVVTWVGNSTDGRNISHSLGSVPGCIIIKAADGYSEWFVYHRSLPSAPYYLKLNRTEAQSANASPWSTAPTSTTFSVNDNGGNNTVNSSGVTYVAYLFAHNAGGFGLTGTDNVISCGSFTTDGSGNATVNLGYEPQWIMARASATTDYWRMFDTMRGLSLTGNKQLTANTSDAESTPTPYFYPNATGFTTNGPGGNVVANATYIYIAIRRGPMKTPTSGTSVFGINAFTGDGSGTRQITTQGVTTDLILSKIRSGYGGDMPTMWTNRLRGGTSLGISSNQGDANSYWSLSGWYNFAVMDGYAIGGTVYAYSNQSGGTNYVSYGLKRAPSVFDVVNFTAASSTNQRVNHNLTVAPELLITKEVGSNQTQWFTYSATLGRDKWLDANANAAASTYTNIWGTSDPTATDFGVYSGALCVNGSQYITYLFASCPGVSKVGSYSGTGATQTISCGFAARFVMIKRTDSTGDWWFWDTTRGMVAGTDPRSSFNGVAAENNANWVYTNASGFQIVTTDATVNASGGSYIYLAIA